MIRQRYGLLIRQADEFGAVDRAAVQQLELLGIERGHIGQAFGDRAIERVEDSDAVAPGDLAEDPPDADDGDSPAEGERQPLFSLLTHARAIVVDKGY